MTLYIMTEIDAFPECTAINQYSKCYKYDCQGEKKILFVHIIIIISVVKIDAFGPTNIIIK